MSEKLAELKKSGSAGGAGLPSKNQFIDLPMGTVNGYTVGTQASTTAALAGSSCFINVMGHSSITFPSYSTYNGKKITAIKADGTTTNISTSGTTFDCTDYDYICMWVSSGGNLTCKFTVNA